MMKSVFVACVFLSVLSHASMPGKKLGELPRAAELEKEIESFLPKPSNQWKPLTSALSVANETYSAKSKIFSLKSGAESEEGDSSRFQVHLTKQGKTTLLNTEPVAWVLVTDDEKFLLIEPLKVLNTSDWNERDLAKGNSNGLYFKPLRYSKSTGKLIVATYTCIADCPKSDSFTILEYSLKP